MADPIPLFPVHRVVDPARFAASQHRLFTGQNLHIGRSTTVHAVTWAEWINGLTLPGPACHQGWSGLGAAGELLPSRNPVSCVKCRRLAGEPLDIDQAELTLFSLPVSSARLSSGDAADSSAHSGSPTGVAKSSTQPDASVLTARR